MRQLKGPYSVVMFNPSVLSGRALSHRIHRKHANTSGWYLSVRGDGPRGAGVVDSPAGDRRASSKLSVESILCMHHTVPDGFQRNSSGPCKIQGAYAAQHPQAIVKQSFNTEDGHVVLEIASHRRFPANPTQDTMEDDALQTSKIK